ncbi:flagellar basal body rod protein FlgC [Microvirga brassicacearum]|jgi:flagellar basal-body rod protein FlgC|uniref:Flagellar basal-body rod protein FlgC n=1 Tax=Microvirga brassicacearum TaxID=2580413 RepID=A0A5N3P3P5_9HYPH|nr:flagellar basal body rod protein FlgC [Microvirga brassicacearum]KAB0264343.1 flagellar basal body rod protein FlgC [Microvirga brassicacearum]
MIDPLIASSKLSGAGLEAQSMRLRVVSENVANASSTGRTEGSDPYTRKTITFRSQLDRALGAASVSVKSIGEDSAPYPVQYDPGNPAADENGMVKMPNINVLTEMTDMREANRSYEANLQMIKQVRSMISATIDLLRT